MLPDSDSSAPDSPRTSHLIRYEPWLRLLARREIDSRFQGKFSASDAVQQTLLEAWRDWDQFQGDGEPQRQAWLRRILAHQLAHLARHYAGTQKRDISKEFSIDASLANSSMRLERVLAAEQTSPSGHCAAEEQSLLLARVLEQLPRDYAQVILLRHLEDLPHEEVARRMHRSPGAVRMLWVRALAALRDKISAEDAGFRSTKGTVPSRWQCNPETANPPRRTPPGEAGSPGPSTTGPATPLPPSS